MEELRILGRPWHNWLFAAYYLFFGLSGISAIFFTPTSIEGVAGPALTYTWGGAGVLVGIVGIAGALGLPFFPRHSKRSRPNFRWETFACWLGILSTFIYSSTIVLIIFQTDGVTRSAQAFAVARAVFPLALRIIYFHLREKQERELRRLEGL